MSWTCEQTELRLSDHLDGQLSAAESAAFAAHRQSCARCAALLASVDGLVKQMQALEPVEEPPRLIYRILDQTAGPRHAATGWRAVLEWLRPAAHPRLAMGLVTVLIVTMTLSQALGIQWGQIELKDLAPASLYRSANSRVHLLYARGAKFVSDLRIVYEIQSRLPAPQEPQPQPQPQPQQQQQPAPGTTERSPEKRERDINRADDLKTIPLMLASAMGGAAGRSVR